MLAHPEGQVGDLKPSKQRPGNPEVPKKNQHRRERIRRMILELLNSTVQVKLCQLHLGEPGNRAECQGRGVVPKDHKFC